MSLPEWFDTFEDGCYPTDAIQFNWHAKGIGFGSMYFYQGEDGKVHCDNEMMGKAFLKNMLCKMVDDCVLDCERQD